MFKVRKCQREESPDMLSDKYFAYLQLERFWEPTTSWNNAMITMNRPITTTVIKESGISSRSESGSHRTTKKVSFMFSLEPDRTRIWSR